MENKVKDNMAKMLAEWLFNDFGILIEAPAEEEIAKPDVIGDYARKQGSSDL